jgi:hypothetical protein
MFDPSMVTGGAIPDCLIQRPQWVGWELRERNGKPTKVPISPHSGRPASTTDPSTWGTFQEATNAATRLKLSGIGYVFSKDDPYTGVDLDKCRDPETGVAEQWTQEVIEALSSYTEISPSGRGFHIIVIGTLPEGQRKRARVEMYSHSRYFTMTGMHVPGTPKTIEPRQEQLDTQYNIYLSKVSIEDIPPNATVASGLFSTVNDDELLERAASANNGDKFSRLWKGDWAGYPSQSEADSALCWMLAFWTSGDQARMDRLFRRSGLYRPKWDEKHYADGRTYGEAAIDHAIQQQLRDVTATLERGRSDRRTHHVAIPSAPWPTLDQAALHGLFGEFVSLLEPHTEADSVAIVLQTLVAFGSLLNRGPYFVAESDRHGMNLFIVLVGQTAKGRKGTSWGHVKRLFRDIDPAWADTRIQSGLSSGEGLIWAVHDEVTKVEAVKKSGKYTGEYQTVVVEPAIEDKRLMVVEPEFANTLNVIAREGNTLSALIRQAWDVGDLRALTKTKKAEATGAHISIVAHITRDEVLRLLNTTEATNGFCNRFLWACVKRSKCLPEGGRLDEVDFTPLIRRLSHAIQFGRTAGRMNRDNDARALWIEKYPQLSEGKPGQFGGIISRAEAQVARLSTLYALADMSPVIKSEHLQAALALWQYCEDSARYIFKERLGDPLADEILSALRSTPTGMTRTEISHWLGRNQKAHHIDRALHVLEQYHLARRTIEGTGSHTTERWIALGSTKYTN